jgi:molybdenum cofactor guanylyltransferase
MDITAIVLAGGQSRRMGQDKSLVTIAGVPLLRQITDLAQAVSAAVVVVTPWPERYQPIVAANCQFVVDRDSEGPLMGLVQALTNGPERVSTEWILLLSCDLPWLQQDDLSDWIEQLATVPDQAIACLPTGEKGWEPLCGFYRGRCLETLQAFADHGGRSFQVWLQTQTVAALVVRDRRVLLNCNTPEDLELARNSNYRSQR